MKNARNEHHYLANQCHEHRRMAILLGRKERNIAQRKLEARPLCSQARFDRSAFHQVRRTLPLELNFQSERGLDDTRAQSLVYQKRPAMRAGGKRTRPPTLQPGHNPKSQVSQKVSALLKPLCACNSTLG